MLDFRKKWYVPENMFLMVVGDVDPAAIRKDVERFTSDVKATGFLKVSLPQEPRQTQIRSAVTRDPNAIETRLDIAFHIPSMKGNDVNKLDLAADILGARDDSRLVRILKSEKALVNSISTDSHAQGARADDDLSHSGRKKPGSGHQGNYGRIGSAR